MPDPLVEQASTTVPAAPEHPTISFEEKFAWIFGIVVVVLAVFAFADWNRRVMTRTREGELSRNTGWEEPPPDDPMA